MITIIPLLQQLHHVRNRLAAFLCQFGYRLGKIMLQLFLRDTAKRVVVPHHADVRRLVEAAKHRDLRELRHARQQHELQVGIRRLERRVKAPEHLPVPLFQQNTVAIHDNFCTRIQHVQQRLVVFVHQHHAATPRPLMRLLQHVGKTPPNIREISTFPILPLPSPHCPFQDFLQLPLFHKIYSVEINMEHRVFQPVLFQTVNFQTFE